MKITDFFQNEKKDVMDSIAQYRKGLMEDMNLTLRLTSNDQTHTTKLVEWVEDILIFEAPMSQLDYIIYPKNANLQLIFVSKSALFSSDLLITKSYRKNTSLYYVAKIISPIVKKQQRESFRLDIVMDVMYQLLPSDDFDESLLFEDFETKKATCINISLGGICINCDEQLHSHDHLSLTFTLVDTPLTLTGEVLFTGVRTEVGTYTHRIKFYGLSNSETNLLNRLIFEKQRMQLKHI